MSMFTLDARFNQILMRLNKLERRMNEAVAAERERCAQIADSMNSTQNIGDRIRYGLGNEVQHGPSDKCV